MTRVPRRCPCALWPKMGGLSREGNMPGTSKTHSKNIPEKVIVIIVPGFRSASFAQAPDGSSQPCCKEASAEGSSVLSRSDECHMCHRLLLRNLRSCNAFPPSWDASICSNLKLQKMRIRWRNGGHGSKNVLSESPENPEDSLEKSPCKKSPHIMWLGFNFSSHPFKKANY